jgi:hypothetical protein
MPRKRNRIDQFYYKNKNLNDICDKLRIDAPEFIEQNKEYHSIYLMAGHDDGLFGPITTRCIYSSEEAIKTNTLDESIMDIRIKVIDEIYKDPWIPILIILDALPFDKGKEMPSKIYGLQSQVDANNRVRNKIRWIIKKELENNTQTVV